MDNFKFSQNEEVEFRLTKDIQGVGEIVGCATTELPVMGRTYIVKILEGCFPSVDYPFNTIVIPEIHLIKKDCNIV
jgi:hypothetical protein